MRYAITKCFLCILLIAMPVIANADLGKETGLRVPRFVSMNSSKVNVRAGPGTRYPIKWVFQRKTGSGAKAYLYFYLKRLLNIHNVNMVFEKNSLCRKSNRRISKE